MVSNHKECEGCNRKVTCGIRHFDYEPNIKECPCRNCIVKTMCNQMCELRSMFFLKIAKFSRLKGKKEVK